MQKQKDGEERETASLSTEGIASGPSDDAHVICFDRETLVSKRVEAIWYSKLIDMFKLDSN